MSRSSIRIGLAVVSGTIGAAVLAAAIGASDADAARPSKRKRKPDRTAHVQDAGSDAPAATSAQVADGHAAEAGSRAAASSAPYPRSGLICLYGKRTEDGEERCLEPDELEPPRLVLVDTRELAEQLGMLKPEPPEDAGAGSDGGAERADDESALSSDGSFKARVVRVQFENGAVGGAQRSLKQIRSQMADCVADNGGLRSESARIKLLFYVRGDGKASGVMVASARNVPPAVVRCVTRLVDGAPMGRPSASPVGVKTLIELKENEAE